MFDLPFGSPQQPVAARRYRLIRAAMCPFAQRPVIARALLGLEDAVSLGTTSSVNTEQGWQFALDEGGRDPVLQVPGVRELYQASAPDYTGPFSVPVLVDTATGQIVRRESMEILRDFSTTFRPLHRAGAPDLYPPAWQSQIDEWNEKLSQELVANIYRMGRTTEQAVYDQAFDACFASLDALEQRLASRRYFHGERLTETDIVLFTPLVRFDLIYHPVFGANRQYLRDYPHLWGYVRELYQMPAFKDSTDFAAIKQGYYSGTGSRYVYAREIVPKGPDLSAWDAPHGRSG